MLYYESLKHTKEGTMYNVTARGIEVRRIRKILAHRIRTIIATDPEYNDIVEGAIASNAPDTALGTIALVVSAAFTKN